MAQVVIKEIAKSELCGLILTPAILTMWLFTCGHTAWQVLAVRSSQDGNEETRSIPEHAQKALYQRVNLALLQDES